MVKYKEVDIEKMKRPELEKIINDNNLGIEIKIGMSNKELIKAVISKLSESNLISEEINFEGKTKLELMTLLEERAFSRDQLIALVTSNSLDLVVDELNDDELAEAILKILDIPNNDGDKGDVLGEIVTTAKVKATSATKTARNLKEEAKQGITDRQITAEQRAYARKLCIDYKVTEVFVNPIKTSISHKSVTLSILLVVMSKR